MAEYKHVKVGKLKLKGQTSVAKKHKSKKRSHESSDTSISTNSKDEDAAQHGGWWAIKSFEQLQSCNVALQTFKDSNVLAVDNGTLTIGDDHGGTEDGPSHGPAPEEIFTLVKLNETKVAFKSGYGKYLSVNARGDVIGRSDAIGPQEQIEVVIQDEKVALQGHNGYFITVTDSGELKALSSVAREHEIFRLRTNASRGKKKKVESEEDILDSRQCEINYVKRFQSFQDHKLRLTTEDVSKLDHAKQKGKLHEAMLDRREKMKADRYCK